MFNGHGVGREFHCLPLVLHHLNDEPGEMLENSIFTIEPILQVATPESRSHGQKFTHYTANGQLAAQFEHAASTLELTLKEKDDFLT